MGEPKRYTRASGARNRGRGNLMRRIRRLVTLAVLAVFQLLAIFHWWDESGEIMLIPGVMAQSMDPAASIEEFFHLWHEFVDHVPRHMTICQFGLPPFHEASSVELLERFTKPKYNAYIHLFKVSEDDPGFLRLNGTYPGQVFQFETVDKDTFDSYCSMIITSLYYPNVTFEEVSILANKIPSIFLAYFKTECSAAQLECRWMSRSWDAIFGDGSFCGTDVCLGMVPSESVFDEVMEQNPMMDCDQFVKDPNRPASWTTQWQQDWFVYHNFFTDHPEDGVFVDVGAYHPFKYSNSLFFEKCLGWSGLCVEPNPYHAPLFRTYRKCNLVPHCVWSKEKSITMSFAKDMIEAAVPDDEGTIPDGLQFAGHELENSKAPAHQFDAVCLTLDQILEDNGLVGKTIHFISLDAEHAEVEILKVFPFWKYDIKTWVIEIQTDNFYMMDSILLNNGFAKVGILGGDHVYMAIGNWKTKLDIPANNWETQQEMNDPLLGWHKHKAAKKDY